MVRSHESNARLPRREATDKGQCFPIHVHMSTPHLVVDFDLSGQFCTRLGQQSDLNDEYDIIAGEIVGSKPTGVLEYGRASPSFVSGEGC